MNVYKEHNIYGGYDVFARRAEGSGPHRRYVGRFDGSGYGGRIENYFYTSESGNGGVRAGDSLDNDNRDGGGHAGVAHAFE